VGSQGLGRGFALALAAHGADVAVVHLPAADEEETAAATVSREISALGRDSLVVPADLRDPDAVQQAVDQVLDRLGRIDVLVNNVGGFPTKTRPLVEMSDEDWDQSIALNLRTPFLCCRAVAPLMQRQRYGRIVNISASLSAFMGWANASHYSAAKSGLVAMTRALARELAASEVTVNAVAPGHIETPMNRRGIELGWWDEADELEGTPVGRGGTVEDVARAVVFFASNEAGWITGQTLNVNGGSFMH
jgi:3-oxoacyl-[acyl-carrier protein] reductase